MTDTAKFEQFGLSAFYNNIPVLDNAGDWFRWNQKVNEFIGISPVADDGVVPPIEEDEARQWTHRQKFYSAMITAKLTHNAAQRINAFEISQVQPLVKAVKDHFKPEGTGTYVNLQRCPSREKSVGVPKPWAPRSGRFTLKNSSLTPNVLPPRLREHSSSCTH
jgi:hypothetical protein